MNVDIKYILENLYSTWIAWESFFPGLFVGGSCIVHGFLRFVRVKVIIRGWIVALFLDCRCW